MTPMQSPLRVVELIRDHMSRLLFELEEVPQLSSSLYRSLRLLPYDLLQLAQVNKTFYQVFMSDRAWLQFGRGRDIARDYLELKPLVNEKVWNHDRLWELALLNTNNWELVQDAKNWPQLFKALLQAISYDVVYNWSHGTKYLFGRWLDSPLVDTEFYRIWQKNTLPLRPLLCVEFLPRKYYKRDFILELLSLGMTPYGLYPEYRRDTEAMYACMQYRYFAYANLKEFCEFFKELLLKYPSDLAQVVAVYPQALEVISKSEEREPNPEPGATSKAKRQKKGGKPSNRGKK